MGLFVLSLPLLFPDKSVALKISHLISGVLLLLFSAAALRLRSVWPQWAITGVGLWLSVAPLIFWASQAAIYISDSLAGMAVMLFAVILPYRVESGGKNTLEDWSYNPSTWKQRLPVVIIGAIAYVVATYLAFFQLGYISSVWDPFFGEGTQRVLTSEVSKAFPVSDAGLGAFAYLLECLSGLVGNTRRWRTLPWMALLFWVLVVPAGVVSIVLVMLQPISVGAWCALCLATAFLTLITIPPAMDELVLTGQFLWEQRRKGKNILRLFWQGNVEKGPEVVAHGEDKTFDLSLPWNLVLSAAIGLGLMAMPAALSLQGALANSHFMSGALILTFAVIGMSEVGRPFRLLNVLLGLGMLLSPWVFAAETSLVRGLDALAGLLVGILAIPRGSFKDRHGVWDRFSRIGV